MEPSGQSPLFKPQGTARLMTWWFTESYIFLQVRINSEHCILANCPLYSRYYGVSSYILCSRSSVNCRDI